MGVIDTAKQVLIDQGKDPDDYNITITGTTEKISLKPLAERFELAQAKLSAIRDENESLSSIVEDAIMRGVL